MGQDQGNAERRVIDKNAVGGLAMLSEGFAVVRGQNDERSVQRPGSFEAGEKPSQGGIGVSDLAVVFPAPISRGIRRRRLVRGMGIEIMDPSEERRGALLPEPGRGRGVDIVRLAFDEGQIARGIPAAVMIVIDLEAAVEPEARIEGERPDERPRAVASLPQDLGQRPASGLQALAVVARPVRRRIRPGHDRGVGRQGQRGRRERPGKKRPAPGQAVDMGRFDAPIPVSAEMIGPKRVDRDEEDVRPIGRGRGGKGRGAESQAEGRRDEGAQDAAFFRSHAGYFNRNGGRREGNESGALKKGTRPGRRVPERTERSSAPDDQIAHFRPSRRMRGARIEVTAWNELPDWLFQPRVV